MSPKSKRAGMVGWYNPLLLIRTGVEVVISTLFGGHADRRLMQSVISGPAQIHDYSIDPVRTIDLERDGALAGEVLRKTIWIDFVADTGDGWDSTYAVAYSVASALSLTAADGTPHPTQRGAILVLGGDVVYPSATPETYQDKLLHPYEQAFDSSSHAENEPRPGNPDVFAIPGNHDWYDSLVSFSKQFCSRVLFAGCRTRQRRSYFALKLPHGWWLLGIDVQLGSDLDGPQIEYFARVGEHMAEGDRVILCTHEPQWIYRRYLGKHDPAYKKDCLQSMEEEVLRRKISVFLAGDLHHYRRHESAGGVQKITAGGGGAFLHPTHGRDVSELRGGFVERCSYPDAKTSWWLTWRNALFLGYNPLFGVIPALLYLLLAWNLLPTLRKYREDAAITFVTPPRLYHVFDYALREVVEPTDSSAATGLLFWFLLISLGFVLFTDVKNNRFRIPFGLLHGLVHYLVLLCLLWVALEQFYDYELPTGEDLQGGPSSFGKRRYTFSFWCLSATLFASGWAIGSVILGAYLLISLNLFKVHWNEAFSSLRIADWKNFLRMQIDEQGALTLYPIGIPRVARKWKDREGTTGPLVEPVPAEALAWKLIESPIVLH
jgi:hypothetical protein